MENPEEVLQSLDEFAKMKPKDIPRELEDYLSYVAKTGDPVYQWSIVKCLFREKLLNVITDFYETSPTIDLPPCPNVDPFNYETLKNSLLERLDSFPSAPFTVQRLCELLTTPRKEYSRADKFMRAIEKNILVVSTREPGNVRRSDNGQPELLMNGVMDGRGIELGEAIETVSSDGVNLMHSEENEVNVTENDNVSVECASMEEIDMEEQSDHMEPTNPNAWEKEQSDISIQSEENETMKNYNGNVDEDNKPKESSESLHDGNADDTGENSNEPEEAPASTENENVTDSFSPVIPEDPQVELDACSSSSKDILENNEEKCDKKEECVDSETSLLSEVSTTEDTDSKPVNEDTPESVTPNESADTEESPEERNVTPEEDPVNDSVNITSVNEDLPAVSSTSESNLVEEDTNDESPGESTNSDTNLVVDGCSSSESVIAAADSPEEVISKSDSVNTEIPTEQLSEKSIDSEESKTTEVVSLEVANINAEEFVSSEVPPVESSDKNSEEKVSDDPPPEAVTHADIVESGCDSTKEHETEQTTVTKAIVCQQEEAMEVDDNVSSQVISTDVDEPMDQSEQLTEGQLER